MKLILQRVTAASVTVNHQIVGEIGKGYLVFFGVSQTDTEKQVEKMADKISRLRIFEDENGKTNLSAAEVSGELLVVSQFTLYADCRKGNRPSFIGAGDPELANRLYLQFIETCKGKFKKVASGVFGGDMKVALCNDGPFTLVLESDD